jgi:hypothetical protein
MFTPEQLQTIKDRLENGETPAQVAVNFDMSRNTLDRKLAAMGWQVKRTIVPITTISIGQEEMATD